MGDLNRCLKDNNHHYHPMNMLLGNCIAHVGTSRHDILWEGPENPTEKQVWRYR